MRPTLLPLLALAWVSACGGAPASTDPQPARTPPVTEAPAPWTKGGMVAVADPRAAAAAVDVLERGGHAVDAAIAAHAVLGLVEPQSSGIGGGAFMVVYDRESDTLTSFNGREIAPAYVTPDHFLQDGAPMGFIAAWQSGRSIGVPGQIALYKTAHDRFGTRPWGELFEDAISLASGGFEVSPRLAGLLSSERLRRASDLDDLPGPAAYFYPDGEPLQAGDVRDNPDYAATLKAIAANGPAAFYTGDIAAGIVEATNAGPSGGAMTLDDLASYTVLEEPLVCGDALNHRICSQRPPSSGAVTQIMIAGLYERFVAAHGGEMTGPERFRALVDAQRLAYADRDHYVADPARVDVPVADLINPAYLDARALERFEPSEPSVPGDPGAVLRNDPIIDRWGRDLTDEAPGTTHLSIMDARGNVVSMTATVEAPFGSSRWTGGFLLNNQLTDFAFAPTKNGKPVANAPDAGKRPRSSMSPTIIFDQEGDVKMVTGSPGGNSIIAYVSKTVVGVLDWDLTAQEAVDLPNVIARGDRVGVEISKGNGQAIADDLKALGYEVREGQGENSGLHVIVVRETGLEGGADPRREGVAIAVGAAE